MPVRIRIVLLLYIFSTIPFCHIVGQSLPIATTSFKGLWVTQFKDLVLGNTTAENALLTYAETYGFNYLICTNMFLILTEDCGSFTAEMTDLQAFIEKAHTVYNIEFISGNVGSSNTASKIESYNNCVSVTDAQKFDMITYECEFYNDATNGSCPTYSSFIGQLNTIKTICDATSSSDPANDLICEVYIGGAGSTGAVLTHSSESEMEEIASTADHVLLTYYRSTPASSGGNFFNWTIDRLEWIASPTVIPNNIVLLLKSRDTDSNNMYDYLHTYGGTHAEAIIDPYYSWVDGTTYNMSLSKGYSEQFDDGTYPWLSGIKVDGFTWFEHDAIQEILALPIELSSFEVKMKSDGMASLVWSTASESNNNWFLVERSKDASSWNQIGRVRGNGDSFHRVNYSYLDIRPYIGKSYYRLLQKDFDGQISYSEIVSITNKYEKEMDLQQPLIYPIPSHDRVTIEQESIHTDMISLYSQTGIDVTKKIHYNLENNYKLNIDLSRLPYGVYTLKIGNNLYKIIK